jgi:catechol 2,3-dioxygenase-like lactoylglutathione lyase family enzyme
MIKLKSVRHAGVPVSDVRKSKSFYKLLGFEEIERPKIKGIPGAWYECNGTQVHLIGQRNDMAAKNLPGVGTHIALQVENLEEAKKALKKRKIEFAEFTPPASMGGAPVLFLKDPDGNAVELRTDP